MNDEHDQFLEDHLKKLESLKKILRGEHPDSVILTEAYERLSRQGVDVKL
jgi:hypothetical protein